MAFQELNLQRKHVIWLRWLLVIATSYLLYFSVPVTSRVIEILILAFISSNIVVGLLPHWVFNHPVFYYIVVPLDTTLVAGAMYLSGDASTDFYLTFFLIIIIAATGRKLGYIVVGASAIILFYGWMMWSADLAVPLLRIPFLFVVAVFIGHLTEQALSENQRYKEVLEDKIHLEVIQSRLLESEAKFRQLTETLSSAIFICIDNRCNYVNTAAERVSGYSREELQSMSLWSLVAPESRASLKERFHSTRPGSAAPIRDEVKIRTRSGEECWLDVNLGVVEFEGRLARIGTAHDITERKRMEYELMHSASHDPLTGLPNRERLTAALLQLIEASRNGDNALFAVLYLDLDRFKLVNDSLGHDIGDDLLVAVARRLTASLRPGDLAARLGGDEFVVVLSRIRAVDDAMRVAERVHQELTQPFNFDGQEVFISTSIGVVTSSTPYDSPAALLRDADMAMYDAKTQKRRQPQIFHTSTHSRAVRLLELETDLRRALERNELRAFYQPIVNLENRELCGFEALIRWQHPVRGLISPDQFIPLAEESGLIISIGWWITREACRQMREWQKQYPTCSSLSLSVNLSYRQFMQADLVERIDQILKETGLEPARLNLEFTENVVLESSEATAVKVLLLKALGVRLLIDDFGTGYTLLSHLHRFPTDILKIDRSFISGIGSNGENSELVQMIMKIAQSMGAEVIAEGVETAAQLSYLQAMNCRFGQGYLFSRPVVSETAGQFIATECGLEDGLSLWTPQSNYLS